MLSSLWTLVWQPFHLPTHQPAELCRHSMLLWYLLGPSMGSDWLLWWVRWSIEPCRIIQWCCDDVTTFELQKNPQNRPKKVVDEPGVLGVTLPGSPYGATGNSLWSCREPHVCAGNPTCSFKNPTWDFKNPTWDFKNPTWGFWKPHVGFLRSTHVKTRRAILPKPHAEFVLGGTIAFCATTTINDIGTVHQR